MKTKYHNLEYPHYLKQTAKLPRIKFSVENKRMTQCPTRKAIKKARNSKYYPGQIFRNASKFRQK